MTQATVTICPNCNDEDCSYYLYPDQETTFCNKCGYLEEHEIGPLGNVEHSHIVKTPYAAYEYITSKGIRYFGSIPSKVKALAYIIDCKEDERCVSLIYHKYKDGEFSQEVVIDKNS